MCRESARGSPDLTFGRRAVLQVAPVVGSATLFYSLRPDGAVDAFSFHGGCPPTEAGPPLLRLERQEDEEAKEASSSSCLSRASSPPSLSQLKSENDLIGAKVQLF